MYNHSNSNMGGNDESDGSGVDYKSNRVMLITRVIVKVYQKIQGMNYMMMMI